MKHFPCIAAGLFLLSLLCLPAACTFASGWPGNNDNIFPSVSAARASIDFDGRGFLVHGKRIFVVAGELQYPRTPRAQWRERLLRMKRAGYNTVQTYVFWNYHEPVEGQFDFSGEKDLNAYLQLIHSLGMYAIVRMGPYVNAEWDTGGLPVWLRFKPGLRPMTDNPPFYRAVDPYFDRLVPILAANQISHGGPILMVQMENEHIYPAGGGSGTDLPDAYYRWFYKKMRYMGLQVPLFFSGLNHSDDPAGDSPFDISLRTSPWYSTEFWVGWVGVYGVAPDRAKKLERATWKVIAYGGAGYTHYTMVGGTDFDTWNNNEQAASYDFGSPIGQAGDLRESYYQCKRAAMFATSFASLLADSLAKDGGDGAVPTTARVSITYRKGKAGEARFLDNKTDTPLATQIKIDGRSYPSAGLITLTPGEIVPILTDYPLAPGIILDLAAARLLGVTHHGALSTLVIYGNAGEPVELHLAAVHPSTPAPNPELTLTAASVVLKTTVPIAAPKVTVFQTGGQTLRILTMSTQMADRTWFLEDGAMIACGPDYVGDVLRSRTGAVRLETEKNGMDIKPACPLPFLLYNSGIYPLELTPVAMPASQEASASPPSLGPWMMDAAFPMTQPSFDDNNWKASREPLQMGADGDYSAYAWYRSTVSVPSAGTYQLNLSDSGDWVSCFVNGEHAASTGVQVRYQSPAPRHMTVRLRAGSNQLAFLTAHYGRNKLFNYYDSMETIDAKGISGPVSLTKSIEVTQNLNSFRWQADDQAPGDAVKQSAPDLDTAGTGWSDASTSTDVFHGRSGWAWFRTILPIVTGPHRRLFFHSIDDRGVVYLNGKQLASDVGINGDTSLSLDAAWNGNGSNVLAVAVQNTGGAGGLLGDIRLESGIEDGQEVPGWKMKGGTAVPAFTSTDWKPVTAARSPGTAAFYHATFQAMPPGPTGPHPILRATFTNLSRGFMWLNGRNLGRYPEKSPIDSLYFPESLLKTGKNDLVIFDEDGNSPSDVRIVVENKESRTASILQATPSK